MPKPTWPDLQSAFTRALRPVKIFSMICRPATGTEANPNPKYLLLALNYLKDYPIDLNLAGPFGVSEKTALLWAKRYLFKVAALKETKVSLAAPLLLPA